MRSAPLILLLALTACTYSPSYTGIHCGPGGSCPEGFTCIQDLCFPDQEEPAEEVSPDGDAGTDDAGTDDAGADDAGADAPGDGDPVPDDIGRDAGDTPGDDAAPDADGGAGDDDACGGCPDDEYCDENANPPECKPCEDTTHCGIDCQPCAAGESCIDKNGTFCCFPPCSQDNLCQLVQCGGREYVCRAFFGPLSFDWNPVEINPPHWCRLSQADGPILDDLRCFDGNNLQYYCPWDGICADGQCIHNPAVERTHPCGLSFGCEGDSHAGHCRMHRKDYEDCTYNFDCESFCCSQDNNAQCIPYDAAQCKIHLTLYWEFTNLYTWIAKGTSDFHDINQWTFQGGEHGVKCTGDSDCDSGHCRNFTVAGENRCEFHTCVDAPEAADIKATYFCETGDHNLHITTMTNQNPVPPPDACD